jgi:DNA-binding CsgD family transcriptional regulator
MTELDTDRQELIALIHRNRIAIWTQDFATYQTCFVHADYTTRWNASRFHGISIRQDWNDIAARVQQMFVEHPDWYSETNAHETTVENLRLQIRGDMAWATFDQHYPSLGPAHDFNLFGKTHEVRIFERHDGAWRIAFWGVMDKSIGGRESAILHLAPDGSVIWTSPLATVALKEDDDLVIRNGRLRVRDSRTDQKLQAALRWAGSKDTSLFPEHAAVPIVLEAGEGVATKVWWVIAESGVIVFSMGERGLNERRLDTAAAVFGLSPAQKQLAALVADGQSLAEIAAVMKITPATARTHLNRVYEKVGVRTQPALVRVLLSAVSPL